MVQATLFTKKLTREELNSLIDRAADLIRTAVDYKFILVLLFLKRLNDLWKTERRQVKERLVKELGFREEEAEAESEKEVYHAFNIPKRYLWDEITKEVKTLPEKHEELTARIIKFLEEYRRQAVKDLAKKLGVNRIFLSGYLKALEKQGYVKWKKIGPATVYFKENKR